MSEAQIPCYMMGTTAIHRLGDISSDEPDLCYIQKEDEDNYIGVWVMGYGLIEVKFPKKTTRVLTAEEIEKYNKIYVRTNNHPAHKLKVD